MKKNESLPLEKKKAELEKKLSEKPPKEITIEYLRLRDQMVCDINIINRKLENLKQGKPALGESIGEATIVGINDHRRLNVGRR
jgi:hypothetical protein